MDANVDMPQNTSSQPVTLLVTAFLSALGGVGSSAGFNHFKSLEADVKIDQVETRVYSAESRLDLIDYKIDEIKSLLKGKCQGDDKYSALAHEGVKVKLLD